MIEHLILLKIKNIMDINFVLLQWFINFFLKKKIVSLVDESTFGGTVKNQNISTEELVEGFHKPI